MTLLRDIQAAASDSSGNLADLLRKTKILGRRLGNTSLEQWADRELQGYASGDDLPPYRVVRTESVGRFEDYRRRITLRIPTEALPESGGWREMATTVRARLPVSYYESMLNRPKIDGDLQGQYWSTQSIARAQRDFKFYTGDDVLQTAWRVFGRSEIVSMLDAIRTRILTLVLDLEAEDPDAGEASSPTAVAIEPERIAQIVNNTIFVGGSQNVAISSQEVTQETSQEVLVSDLESLLTTLRALGIREEDLADLPAALDDDQEEAGRPSIGHRVGAWIEAAATKAAPQLLAEGAKSGASRLPDLLAAMSAAVQSFIGA